LASSAHCQPPVNGSSARKGGDMTTLIDHIEDVLGRGWQA
jgi:hypothetical protein